MLKRVLAHYASGLCAGTLIAIGGGVLQAILEYTGVLSNVTGQNAWEV